MQRGVYGQTLPIDGKMRKGGWAKLSRKEVILCGNFPLSCQHVSQEQGTTAWGSDRKRGGGSSKKECLECLNESVPTLRATTYAASQRKMCAEEVTTTECWILNYQHNIRHITLFLWLC